jgi:hypothetical protein
MELGALGEFLSSLAVLITLVYLAIQVNQTKRAVQSSSHQTGLSTMAQNNQKVFETKEMADIVANGLSDDLRDATDTMRFNLYCISMFHVFQQYFLDAERGLGDLEVWKGEERAMKGLLATPGVARWWKEAPFLPYTGSFIARVNSILDAPVEEAAAQDIRKFENVSKVTK